MIPLKSLFAIKEILFGFGSPGSSFLLGEAQHSGDKPDETKIASLPPFPPLIPADEPKEETWPWTDSYIIQMLQSRGVAWHRFKCFVEMFL